MRCAGSLDDIQVFACPEDAEPVINPSSSFWPGRSASRRRRGSPRRIRNADRRLTNWRRAFRLHDRPVLRAVARTTAVKQLKTTRPSLSPGTDPLGGQIGIFCPPVKRCEPRPFPTFAQRSLRPTRSSRAVTRTPIYTRPRRRLLAGVTAGSESHPSGDFSRVRLPERSLQQMFDSEPHDLLRPPHPIVDWYDADTRSPSEVAGRPGWSSHL